MKNRRVVAASLRKAGMLMSALALAGSASAIARQSITYFGSVDLNSFSSVGDVAGELYGKHDFSASFHYDDLLDETGATLRVDGVTRENFNCAAPHFIIFCPALAITPTSLSSSIGTTPEDGISANVSSPSGFGGVSLLGPGHKSYVVRPEDETFAFVTWALFDNRSGFAYVAGDGTVSRIEASVPEPASWALMIGGFGLVGIAGRRRRATVV